MYEKLLKLRDNEIPAKVNTETGEIMEVKRRKNNIPDGYSRLKYDNFGIINLDMLKVLKMLLTDTEIGIVISMIMKAEYESNSLAPLNDETSIRQLSEVFGISPSIVKKTFIKLFDLGVYAQLKIARSDGNAFWILNPNIYWKGRIKQDSIFLHFENTTITKMVK